MITDDSQHADQIAQARALEQINPPSEFLNALWTSILIKYRFAACCPCPVKTELIAQRDAMDRAMIQATQRSIEPQLTLFEA